MNKFKVGDKIIINDQSEPKLNKLKGIITKELREDSYEDYYIVNTNIKPEFFVQFGLHVREQNLILDKTKSLNGDDNEN